MNRSPLLFLRMPPSPRTPSVTRMPRTDSGHTMPVGWNCVNSTSISSAPASYAIAMPSPVYSHEFDVTGHALPPPPVARITALQRKITKRPVSRQYASTPAIAIAVLQQLERRALHVEVDALVDAVILQRADQLEAGAIADVREPRIAMAAEVALRDQAFLRAIEDRAPLLELA